MSGRFPGRATLWASAVIIAAAIAAGVALDARGFAGNLLAEASGVIVSALLTVLVVERLLERDRRRRWHVVAQETHETLRMSLVLASLPAYLALPSPKPLEADPRVAAETDGLATGLEGLEHALRAVGEQPDGKPFSLEHVLDPARPHLERVSSSVLPRLLTLGKDPDLLQRLMTLEATVTQLDYRLWTARALMDEEACPPMARQEAIRHTASFVRAIADVARQLDVSAAAEREAS